jgi:hypothetical protein
MVVVTAVSSRNTSLAGSSKPCSRIQRRRALGHICTLSLGSLQAFFKGDVVPLKKARQRAAAGSNAIPSELCSSFFQGQVRLVRNYRDYAFRLVFEWRNTAAARLRRGAPTFIPALHPLDDRTHTHAKMLSGFMPGCACFNQLDKALTQVTGVRLWHRYPRVRESMLKQSPIHSLLGIPRFKSAGSGFSLVSVLGSRLN